MVLFQQTKISSGLLFLSVLTLASANCAKHPKTFGVYAEDAKTRLPEVPFVLQACACEDGYCKDRSIARTEASYYRGARCTFGITGNALSSAVLAVNRAEFYVYIPNPSRIEHFKIGGKGLIAEQGCTSLGYAFFCGDAYWHGTAEIKQEVEPKGKGVFVLRAAEDLAPNATYYLTDQNPNAPKAYLFRLEEDAEKKTASEDEEVADQGDIIEDEGMNQLETINARWTEFTDAIMRQDEQGAQKTFHPAVFDPTQSKRNWNGTWQELVAKRKTFKGSVVVGIDSEEGNNARKKTRICIMYHGGKRLAAKVIFTDSRWWLLDYSSGPCR